MKLKNRTSEKISSDSLHTTPLLFPWWCWIIPPLIGLVVTFLVYFPSFHYPFQFDDLANIQKYYDIRHLTLKNLFLKNSRWISYWLNTLYYGWNRFEPFLYRVGNVFFHSLSGILVFLFILLAFSGLKIDNFFKRNSFFIACCTSLLFLLHPVQTQTVSYVIQGQLEGLSGLCMLLMAVLFLLYNRIVFRPLKIVLLISFFISAFLATGTKEIVIVAPLLLILIDWFFVAQANRQSLTKRWWIHGTIFAIIFGMYLYFLKPTFFIKILGLQHEVRSNIGNALTDSPLEKIRPYSYCISQFRVILHYIWIFIWPFNISMDYDWKLTKSLFSPECLLSFIILLFLAIYLMRRLLKKPIDIISFCFLWFFVLVLPRSSFIPASELLADYKTYAASIGIFILFACFFAYIGTYFARTAQHITQRLKIMLTLGFFLILGSTLGYMTSQRNNVWRSAEEFWFNVLSNAPTRARAYNNYGHALAEKLKFKEAIEYFKKAIALDPAYPDPFNNLAVSYSALQQLDNAIEIIGKLIKLQPHYPEGYNNLASFLMQKKEYDKAEEALKKAISMRKSYGKAHFNLGRLYALQNKPEQAYEAFKNCCTIADFDNQDGFLAYFRACLHLHKYDEALAVINKAIEHSPEIAPVFLINKPFVYYLKKDFKTAQKLCEELLEKGLEGDKKIHFYLGQIYLANQEFEKALQSFLIAEKIFKNKEITWGIALCYKYTGRYPEALEIFEKLKNETNLAPEITKHFTKEYNDLLRRIKSQ